MISQLGQNEALSAETTSFFCFILIILLLLAVYIIFRARRQSLKGRSNTSDRDLQATETAIDVTAQNAVLDALREVTASLMQQTELKELLKTIITWVSKSIGTPHVHISLFDEKEKLLIGLEGLGAFADYPDMRFSTEKGAIGQVYRSGRPLVIRDYTQWDERLHHLELKGVQCLAQVPLQCDNKTLGVIGVAFLEKGYCFDEQEIDLLLRFSELAAIAVKNAQKIDELHRSQKMVTDIFNATGDGIVVNDGETGEILAVNKKLQTLMGYSETEFRKHGITLISTVKNHEAALAVIRTTVREGTQVLYERETCSKCGKRLVLEIHTEPVEIDGQMRCLAVMRDITERKRLEEGLSYFRFRDSLTGVYNRSYFEEQVARLAGTELHGLGFIVCDIDGLKLVNDTLGYAQGDALLKRTAALLAKHVEAPDYVARLGGDEFVVVLLRATKERLAELETQYKTDLRNCHGDTSLLPLSLSTGWAWNQTGVSVEKLLHIADNNMYRQKLHQNQSARSSIVQTLMKALEARDNITEDHADRLSTLIEMMGRQLNMTDSEISDLKLLAQFHDFGKVGIPDRILNKPGKLSAEEMEIMRGHCEIGYKVAKSSPDIAPIAEYVLEHHEYWDGSGYPLGLSRDNIPLPCRILSIVDAYDAMTSDRPYRKAMSKAEAVAEIMRCAGSQFDPALVALFVGMIEETDDYEKRAAVVR